MGGAKGKRIEMTAMEKLFSYGSLRYEPVQRETFGRLLTGKGDVLEGYRLSTITIRDPQVVEVSGEAVHPVVIPTGDVADRIDGVVFEITPEELQRADDYEVPEYKRASLRLASGTQAWVYVKADE